MRRLLFILLALFPTFAAAEGVTVSLLPERPVIERGRIRMTLLSPFPPPRFLASLGMTAR